MSIICQSDKGWVISHYDHSKKLYRNVLSATGKVNLAYNESLFNIITPFIKDEEARKIFQTFSEGSAFSTISGSKFRKRSAPDSNENKSEVETVLEAFANLRKISDNFSYFTCEATKEKYLHNNIEARKFVNEFLIKNVVVDDFFKGGNNSSNPIAALINGEDYVFPPFCLFLMCDVRNFYAKLNDATYDFILLDPPWKNKHVKRRKRKRAEDGYQILNNDYICEIPLEKMLNGTGLVGVWCTNAPNHIQDIKERFFPKWGIDYVATWFWIKVTATGEPICGYNNRNGKKPYERIIFGARKNRALRLPEENKCIMSVPSAFHSHKPPLSEILQDYLPEESRCLELFARYLLPNWTSVGNQVLLLQFRALFEEVR